jgi:hypothetical protein
MGEETSDVGFEIDSRPWSDDLLALARDVGGSFVIGDAEDAITAGMGEKHRKLRLPRSNSIDSVLGTTDSVRHCSN